MKDVVIVSACRTAVGAFGGTLKDLNAAALASIAMKEAIKRAGIDPAIIDDVRFGCCMEPEDALNVARVAALMADIPDPVTAVTVNRVCISGMEAVLSGAALIRGEMADVVLTGGVGLGHPVGSTGCRIMVTLIYAMKKHGKKLGLATLCGGGGVSMATALEMM
jgi:acetyl-CoA C-acetyltransferase